MNLSKKVATLLISKGIKTDSVTPNVHGYPVIFFFDDKDMHNAESLLKKKGYKIVDKDTGYRNKRFTVTEAVRPTMLKIGGITVGRDIQGRSSVNNGIRYWYQIKSTGAKHMEPDFGKFWINIGNYLSSAEKVRVKDALIEISVDKQGFRKYEKRDDSDFDEPRKDEKSEFSLSEIVRQVTK